MSRAEVAGQPSFGPLMAEPGRTIQLTENRINRCNILLQHNHEAEINRGIGYSSPRCLVSGLQSWPAGRRALPISAEFPQKSSLADWLDRRRRPTAKEAQAEVGQITQQILRETTCVRPIPEITTILSTTLQSFSRAPALVRAYGSDFGFRAVM